MSPFWMVYLGVALFFAVQYSWMRRNLPGLALMNDYEGLSEWQIYLILILLWPLAALARD